jgi:hypothetical protein
MISNRILIHPTVREDALDMDLGSSTLALDGSVPPVEASGWRFTLCGYMRRSDAERAYIVLTFRSVVIC